MKTSIYFFLICLLFLQLSPALAQEGAQEEDTHTGLLQQADVLRCYRKMKQDMEEKGRNLKSDKKVSAQEIEEFETLYKGMRKGLNKFLAQFSEEILAANGAPIDICELNKSQLEMFLKLYHKYEDGFLFQYEQRTDTHPSPLIDANFTASVINCQPKSAVVKPQIYKENYKPDLEVATWASL